MFAGESWYPNGHEVTTSPAANLAIGSTVKAPLSASVGKILDALIQRTSVTVPLRKDEVYRQMLLQEGHAQKCVHKWDVIRPYIGENQEQCNIRHEQMFTGKEAIPLHVLDTQSLRELERTGRFEQFSSSGSSKWHGDWWSHC